MRNFYRLLIVLAVLGLGFAPALASVPKVVFCDDFGWAT